MQPRTALRFLPARGRATGAVWSWSEGVLALACACLLGACFRDVPAPTAPELPRDGDASGPVDPVDGATPSEGDAGEVDAGATHPTDLPRAVIASAPDAPIFEPRASFTLACDIEPCDLECRVDEQPFASCGRAHETPPLRPGRHRFEARARQGDQTGPVSARVFENRLPYELIQRKRPLVLHDGSVALDLRCRRVDVPWDGERVFERNVLPFQCPIGYDLVRADAPDDVRFTDGRWLVNLLVNDAAEHVVRVRVAKPADDPTPWPDGSFTEHTLPIARTAPVPPYVPDAVESPQRGAFQLGAPSFDEACAMVASWHRSDDGEVVGMAAPLGGFYPSAGSQLAHCKVRLPLTVASGWNAAKAELGLRGSSENNGRIDVDVQLDGSPLVEARVDASAAKLSLPITYTNWSPCPRTIELVIDLDLTNQEAVENTAAFLDSMELDFETQGGFGWQTCAQ